MIAWLMIGLIALFIVLALIRRSRMQSGPRHSFTADHRSSYHDQYYSHHDRSADDVPLSAGMIGAAGVGMAAADSADNDTARWGGIGGGGGSWDSGTSDSGSSSWGGDSGGSSDSGGSVD